MSSLKDYMSGKQDGLILAQQIVKERGLEGLEEEIKYRNITGIHSQLVRKEVEVMIDKMKDKTLNVLTILSISVLRDEFEFGKKRIERFIKRLNLKSECLTENFVSWEDIAEDIRNDLGIDVRIK